MQHRKAKHEQISRLIDLLKRQIIKTVHQTSYQTFSYSLSTAHGYRKVATLTGIIDTHSGHSKNENKNTSEAKL